MSIVTKKSQQTQTAFCHDSTLHHQLSPFDKNWRYFFTGQALSATEPTPHTNNHPFDTF